MTVIIFIIGLIILGFIYYKIRTFEKYFNKLYEEKKNVDK